jgi:hypothetical protein
VIDPVELRPAASGDEPALDRLAQLDSARVPAGRLLVAWSGGELRAALSVDTGESIADPFVASAHLVHALKAHATARPTMEARWKPRQTSQPQPAT